MDFVTWERADPGLLSGRAGTRPPTVADELDVDGRVRLRSPASVLVAAGLLARGVPVVRGPVFARTVWDSRGAGQRETVLGADLGGGIGLAVAAGPAWQQAVRDVLTQWLSVAGERTVVLPFPRSFCAGVERAIGAVEQALAQRDGPVYVRKQIVHNTHVVADLESRGAIFVEELDEVPAGATVVFSAHGVSPAVRQQAAGLGLAAIDATCPLVTRVHAKARRFAVRGDPEAITVVADRADVDVLEVPDPNRVTYLTQTTLAIDETADTVEALRARFPKLREPGAADICYATTNRQLALAAVAEDADLVLVVGSANSSNSVRLVEVARRHGSPAYLIDSAADIQASWLAGVRTIGLTAGASAPPSLITAIVNALAGLGPVRVEERQAAQESVHFALPSPVRSR